MVYYYKKKIPSVDDIVIARVDTISEYGVDVTLTEYNNITGFINCSEVSRKKKINMNKLLTIGKNVLLIVILVDNVKNYIDLSKRSINEEEIIIFTEKNKQHLQLYNYFKYIYMKLNSSEKIDKINQDNLYDFMCATLWEIQTELENSEILEKIINKNLNIEIFKLIDCENQNFTMEQIKNIFDDYIDTKLNRIKPTLNESIKLLSYKINGLDDIKYSMDIQNFNDYQQLIIDYDLKISYMTGSIYHIEIHQKEFENINPINIDDAIKLIKLEIKKRADERQIKCQF